MAIEKRNFRGKEIDWDTTINGPVISIDPATENGESESLKNNSKKADESAHADKPAKK